MDERCKSFIAPVKNLVLFLQKQGEDRSLLFHAQLVTTARQAQSTQRSRSVPQAPGAIG